MRLGLTVPYTDLIPRQMMVGLCQEADRLGYDRLWVPEVYGWDAFTTLTQIACATERIGLATGIVNVFSRSPALIAQAAASIDDVSRGRFTLGLGTSGPKVISGWHGVAYEKPLQRLRETVAIVRQVLARSRLHFDAEVFHLDAGLKLITHPFRPAIPIYLASISPGGMALTAEVADGWLPVFFSPRRYQEVLKPQLCRGAARSGRSLDELAICPYQTVVVTEDRQAGRDAVRPQLALYIGGMGTREKNYYNELWRRYGYEEEAERIQDLYLAGRHRDAAQAVTDQMVDEVAVVGPAAECRERLGELEGLGVRELAMTLTVPGNDPSQMLAALKELAPR